MTPTLAPPLSSPSSLIARPYPTTKAATTSLRQSRVALHLRKTLTSSSTSRLVNLHTTPNHNPQHHSTTAPQHLSTHLTSPPNNTSPHHTTHPLPTISPTPKNGHPHLLPHHIPNLVLPRPTRVGPVHTTANHSFTSRSLEVSVLSQELPGIL